MRIKIFASRWYHELEEKVNEWLAENEVSIEFDNIQFVKEDEMFAIMILYEESKEPLCVRLEDLNRFDYEESN